MVILFLSCRNLPRPSTSAEPATEFKSTAVLSCVTCVKGLSEQRRRCLKQQGVRAVFKSETTLRSHLVRPIDAVDPAKQDDVVYRIHCECGKDYIGRPMQNRIMEYDRDIQLARTQPSDVSELWNEVKFIDRDPHRYTHRVKEVIHIKLHPNNINRDSGIEIPEAWMPTVKKQQQENSIKADRRGNNPPKRGSKCANHSCGKPTNHSSASCFIR